MARDSGPSMRCGTVSKSYFVYILASKYNGTLYVGVTNDLLRRVWEHREGIADGFTKTHGVKQLMHFEAFEDVNVAIQRENRLKKWKRQWKIDLIEKDNPGWDDLYVKMTAPLPTPEWLAQANAVAAKRGG